MRTSKINSGRSENNYFAKRRITLMEKDPFCYWCRMPLKLYPDYPEKYRGKPMPKDYPTIEHLQSKFWGPRKETHMKKKTLALACPSCNNERAKKEQKDNIWRTRWKCAAFPRYLKPLEVLIRLYRKQPLR